MTARQAARGSGSAWDRTVAHFPRSTEWKTTHSAAMLTRRPSSRLMRLPRGLLTFDAGALTDAARHTESGLRTGATPAAGEDPRVPGSGAAEGDTSWYTAENAQLPVPSRIRPPGSLR